jgi:hypothetical protein
MILAAVYSQIHANKAVSVLATKEQGTRDGALLIKISYL